MATKKVNKKTIQAKKQKKQKKQNKQQKKSRGFYDHPVIQKITQKYHINKDSIDGFIHKLEQIDTEQFIKILAKLSHIDEAELIASGIAEGIQEIGWQTYLEEFNKEVDGMDFYSFNTFC